MKIYVLLFLVVLAEHSLGQDEERPYKVIRRQRPRPNNQNRHQAPVHQEDTAVAPAQRADHFQCPEKNGFFPHEKQCDAYYECIDNVPTQKLCPDGFAFLNAGPNVEKCEFPFAVDCTGRPELQDPVAPTDQCPRLNGYFAHQDPKICDTFYFCVDGSSNKIVCPNGLVFGKNTGTCTWPDKAHKAQCGSEDVYSFQCPKEGSLQTKEQHPRFADPNDCQYFYVCIDGVTPRRSGCSLGQVYNEQSQRCDKPINVPECKDWYEGILDFDENGDVLLTPPTKKPNVHTGKFRN